MTLGLYSDKQIQMSEPNLDDLRAIETILMTMSPLAGKEQVRVLTWVIEKLDLALDMKLAIRNARSEHRSYIDMAWEKAGHLMDHPSEFLAAAATESMADRVLVIATFLQMRLDNPDRGTLTGREINAALRNMRLSVANVTDCIYTLMERTPAHMIEAGRSQHQKNWKAYRVTESGIDYVYERIALHNSDDKSARGSKMQ